MKGKIRQYISDNMNAFIDEEILDDDNIFEKGFVNSIFAMQLLNFIESNFDIEISDDYIVLSNFSTINNMVKMIEDIKNGQ